MATKAEIEQIMLEAAKVDAMTNTDGWQIIKSYCQRTIKASHDSWLYAEPKSVMLEKLRTEARTAHAMLSLVENFREQGKQLWNLWAKAEGILPETAMDMDNNSPNIEEN